MAPLYTIIFPFEGDKDVSRVLLGLKKRGMGDGLWNGFGGKVEAGETIAACAHRELEEECGLQASRLEYVGVLYIASSSGIEYTIFVYTARGLTGELCESDEMRPQWFGVDELPYELTHTEAKLWWPTMLSGATFTARFVFDSDDLVEHCIEYASQSQLEQLQLKIVEDHNSRQTIS
ncbi:Nudix (Nucleoside diphosphate linked moiety X)-type motif 1 [Coemansia sp. RSA 720]|nr:Nudix (Nucleoside diphosphate linked moiety X)-type motif 1 [Coemansia sp. RSA 720]